MRINRASGTKMLSLPVRATSGGRINGCLWVSVGEFGRDMVDEQRNIRFFGGRRAPRAQLKDGFGFLNRLCGSSASVTRRVALRIRPFRRGRQGSLARVRWPSRAVGCRGPMAVKKSACRSAGQLIE